jgi:site-specific recombinase XerD
LADFAGCRVSDVSWLLLDAVHVNSMAGWMIVGHKGGKERTIDLVNEARGPLYDYLQQGERKASAYVFTRKPREKARERGRNRRMAVDRGWHPPVVAATKPQERAWQKPGSSMRSISTSLGHDFAHRARECGWSLEEVAYYLGHITKSGMPAIQTTIRYTQVSREHVKEKLKLLRG